MESIEEFGHASRIGNQRFITAIDTQIAETGSCKPIAYVYSYRVACDDVAVQVRSFSH